MEYRLCQNFLRSHDFDESIRAQLVDKDKTPHWKPAHITDVSSTMVNEYFAATGRPELTLLGVMILIYRFLITLRFVAVFIT
jgi:enoyl-CoA hydratase